MKKEIGYQIKDISIAAAETNYTIDFDAKMEYDNIEEIMIYGDTSYSSNRNMQFTQPLKIGKKEIFPTDFDTFLLFPRPEHAMFRKLNEPARGNKVSGRIQDPNTSGFSAYTCRIKLVLSRLVPETEEERKQLENRE